MSRMRAHEGGGNSTFFKLRKIVVARGKGF